MQDNGPRVCKGGGMNLFRNFIQKTKDFFSTRGLQNFKIVSGYKEEERGEDSFRSSFFHISCFSIREEQELIIRCSRKSCSETESIGTCLISYCPTLLFIPESTPVISISS
jgi:hypothetical protein